MNDPVFLPEVEPRPDQKLEGHSNFKIRGYALGPGNGGLEVLIADALNQPRLPSIRSLWKDRNSGRPAPLLVVVLHQDRVLLSGPVGPDPPVYVDVDFGQAERLCREALEQPDRHSALRFLRDALPAIDSPLPGLRNEGFLATYQLVNRAPQLAEWCDAVRHSQPILQYRDYALIDHLGFTREPCDQVSTLLRTCDKGTRVAVAVLLEAAESPELETNRFNGLSPVSYAMSVADRERLPYVLVCQGPKLRLYPVGINVGVGRRGRTETFVEIHTGLLRDTQAGYLSLLFSHRASRRAAHWSVSLRIHAATPGIWPFDFANASINRSSPTWLKDWQWCAD